MTSVLSCLVATIALAAEPGTKGLPFGLPPAPEDAVISHVAPPECLFYLNWAGTASPRASSGSETEKLLAEPEVQECLNALSKVIVASLRKSDEPPPETATAAPASATPPAQQSTPGQPPTTSPPIGVPMTSMPMPLITGTPQSLPPSSPLPPSTTAPLALPDVCESYDSCVSAGTAIPVPTRAAAVAEQLNLKIKAEDYGDWLNVLLTHPTAIFVSDVKIAQPKKAQQKKPNGKATNKPENMQPEATQPAGGSADVEIQAGMVVSLGPDADRLSKKFVKYLKDAKKAGAATGFHQIKIAGKTWYRSQPTRPGDKNRVTIGFYENYFVVGVGKGAVEGILARWNSPAPAWLGKALEQTQVPRRTSITYLNLKAIRDKLLPLAPSKKEAVAVLELLGLYNVDSLVATTGLEDYGMVGRTLLALDGKPRGLLNMVADRPLTAKDLEPIPSNALVALAARVDLDRTFNVLLAACQTAAVVADPDTRQAIDSFKKETVDKIKSEYGVDIHRLLGALGDAWCVYNSPTEGEIAFLGWTAVVPVRDRAVLVDSWEKLCAAGKNAATNSADATEVCKCRFAGHEIYYLAGQAIAPAFCIGDREMVMTLNMPAMKAYLARKDHRSLATLPGVALALGDKNCPAALGYCDTPRLFDFFYPLISIYGSAGAAAAHQAKIDLEPTFWPSAPAIRSHLRPDITTLERTPHGLQVTCRYSLPTGELDWPLWMLSLGSAGSNATGFDVTDLASLIEQFMPTLSTTAAEAPQAVVQSTPPSNGSSVASGTFLPGARMIAQSTPPVNGPPIAAAAPVSGLTNLAGLLTQFLPTLSTSTAEAPQVVTQCTPSPNGYASTSPATSYAPCVPSPATTAPYGAVLSHGNTYLSSSPYGAPIVATYSGCPTPSSVAAATPAFATTPAATGCGVSSYSSPDCACAGCGCAPSTPYAPAASYAGAPAVGYAQPYCVPSGPAVSPVQYPAVPTVAATPYATAPSYGSAPATPYAQPYCVPANTASTANPYAPYYAPTARTAAPVGYPAAPAVQTAPACGVTIANGLQHYPPPGSAAAPVPYPAAPVAATTPGSPAAIPKSCGVTVAIVVAMARSGLDEELIITQIHQQGLAAPLQAENLIYLHQEGVSRNVIAALQGASGAGGCGAAANPYDTAPTPGVPRVKPPILQPATSQSPTTSPRKSDRPTAAAAQPAGASSQIYFTGPEGLTVQWDVTAPGRFDSEQLVAPGRYNFPRGALYRLKLANIPGRPGVALFPSVEVAPAMPRTEDFLAHNAIPLEFTDEDFDQAMTDNFVTKVIYLPAPEFHEMALAGVGTLVSTRLDPGVDPIVEGDRRGVIMAIVRLGNKDENKEANYTERRKASSGK